MDTERKCYKCNHYKLIDEFVKNKTQPLGRAYICLECRREYDRERYSKNKEEGRQRTYKSREKITANNKELLWDYLADKQCVDCSESDPIVLQFDHTGDDKKYNIGAMIGNSYSWNTILKEIEKCELVCANCHIRRTAERAGWWRVLASVTI